MRRNDPTKVTVDCDECGGFRIGKVEIDEDYDLKEKAKCTDCNNVAEQTDEFCAKHGVNIRKSAYNECPRCKRIRRDKQLEQEHHARRANERMHPSVDAPRY